MILTPQQLWKDYDRKSLPLAVSVVSGENTGAYLVRYVYFNGEKTADGVARVYAKLYEPDGAPKTAATVVFDDPDKAVDAFDPSEYLTRGIAVLVIDYTGDAPDKTRYTLYPKSLSYANFSKADLFGEKGSEPDRCCWHTWAISGMRAVTFLESEGYSDIFALGVGYGGLQVWKMCYLEGTVRAGAVIFSGPFAQDASLSYKASVAAAAYAGLIKSPVYIQITSNEQNGSLDYMNELYELSAANGAYFSICARANRVIDPDRADNIAKWFCTHLNGERLPAPPEITAKGSQNQL